MKRPPPRGKALEHLLACDYCPSSDAVTEYLHPKGHVYRRCYSCSRIWDVDKPFKFKEESFTEITPITSNSELELPGYVPGDNFWGRGIDETTWDFYKVATNELGTKVSFPFYDYNGNLVAIKHKTINAKGENQYSWEGDSRRAGLFGHELWKDKGFRRAITLCEGMEDAMACFQMFGGKFASVSIKGGAASAKDLLPEDIKFLEQFEEIVILFDSDEPGRKAAKEIAKSFSKSKVSIVNLGLKDANEYLKLGKTKEFRDAWYAKQVHRPDGLIYSSETKSLITEGSPEPIATYPFESMNEISWGIFSPCVIVLTAGTSSGKSAYLKKFLLHLYHTTSHKLGCIFLEESTKKTLYKFIAQEIGVNIGNPKIYRETPKKIILDAWNSLFAGDRFMFMSHFGSIDIDLVCEQVRYQAFNFGAKFIAIDHISIVVSGQVDGDERKNLDRVMTKLRTIAEELDVVIFIISHLKRTNGTDSHEEGGVTSLSQLRGSGAIAQLADTAWGIERNGQHEDEFQRNIATIRSLKQRESGMTGPAGQVLWDNDTCMFVELNKEDLEAHVEELKGKKNLAQVENEPIMDVMLGTPQKEAT